MKKLLSLVAFAGVAACHSTPSSSPGGDVSGAPTPTAAVQAFFNAVHAGDLQAMSAVWGTHRGPARATLPHDELEKRDVIMQCYFNPDAFTLLEERANMDGRHVFRVQLTRGAQRRVTSATTVQGPSNRWYVESLDIASVRDFCAPPNRTTP